MPNLPSTTEEIEAIYATGPGAVVAPVQQLQLTIAQLTERVSELEQRLSRNSRNSSQPPSADGFNRPPRPAPRSLRQATPVPGT